MCNSDVLISIPPRFLLFLSLVSRLSYLYTYIYIYILLFVQCRIFFFSRLSSFAILCASIHRKNYLFVPCLHSRMIFCVPWKKILCFLRHRICTMFHILICLCYVCRVVPCALFFSLLGLYQSHSDRTTTTTKNKKVD